MRMNPVNVTEYFATARERYEIMCRRQQGCQRPWTEDPIFQAWRFCNVFREDDKTTEWIRENAREPLRGDDAATVVAMVMCRVFNRVETLKILHLHGVLHRWNIHEAIQVLEGEHPVVGAAYVVKTPDGMDKLHGAAEMVDAVSFSSNLLVEEIRNSNSLEGAWVALQQYPCIGSFMAYEIVSDLRHTDLLDKATDIMTWAVPGPGACRGLSWLVASNSEVLGYGGRLVRETALGFMRELLVASRSTDHWPSNWPVWEMREVEHWLCEHYKWVRVKYYNERMKRRFP
jgi:hypothetical protein